MEHKEIGIEHLLPSWFQEDIFARQVQVDRRELRWNYTKIFYRSHSDGSTLYSLDFETES